VPEAPPKIARQFTGGKVWDEWELVPEARLKFGTPRPVDVSAVPPGRGSSSWPFAPALETPGYRSSRRDEP